jgi:hypothetical protein
MTSLKKQLAETIKILLDIQKQALLHDQVDLYKASVAAIQSLVDLSLSL